MTLESLFIRVLNMSLTGSLMILAVLLMRLLLTKAPKMFSYVLWLAVLFRLLCPVSFESGLSLLGVLGVTAGEQGTVEYIPESFTAVTGTGEAEKAAGATAAKTGSPETKEAEEGSREAAVEKETTPISAAEARSLEPQSEETALEKVSLRGVDAIQTGLRAGSVTWMIGAVGLLLYGGGSYVRLKRKLRMAEPKGSRLSVLSDEAAMSGTANKERIYRTDVVPTAFVLGIFRPEIYLPDNLEEKEESYILLHEQIHIKRRDSLYRAAAYLALCLHWFNPLVWLAFHISGMDMEMSCDEAVIRKIGSGVKKEYSHSLLALAAGSSGFKGVPLAFGEGDTERRIKNVLRYKKPAVILVAAAVILCLAAVVFLLGNPKRKTEESAKDAENINYLIPPYLLTEYGGNFPDGIYRIEVWSVSKNVRGIDHYGIFDIANEWDYKRERSVLPFDDDCVFLVNRELYRIQYEEVPFEEFYETVTGILEYHRYPMVYVKYSDGRIVEATLNDADYGLGFSVASPYDMVEAAESEPNYGWFIRNIQSDTGLSGEEVIKEYYTLVRTQKADVSDAAGEETIEIYTGSIGGSGNDSESGIVVVRDSNGNMLHTATADTFSGAWNNIYLAEIERKAYLMEVNVFDRNTYGRYSYEVYRLGENGELLYSEVTRFDFDDGKIGYDDERFHIWADRLVYYLDNSRLLLSTQDGVIRTEPVSDADKYNYETLKR